MSNTLKRGDTLTRRVKVAPEQTIDFMGEDCRVYATPSLIADIEHACRDLIFEKTPKGVDSVGTRVSIVHSAATLLGMAVEVSVTIRECEGRRVLFDVTASDPLEGICTGQHERFVVDIEKTKTRLVAKAARVAAL